MESFDYELYTSLAIERVEADPKVLGLILVGSTAEPETRDEWSDHDFWIITFPGAQGKYLHSPEWLPFSESILLSALHGENVRSVLYLNHHMVEYAVFDQEQVKEAKLNRYKVTFDRARIESIAKKINEDTLSLRANELMRFDKLSNLCLLIWTAYQRSKRGELLSAYEYIHYAIDEFLDLLVGAKLVGGDPAYDALNPRRRLERYKPDLGVELSHIVREKPEIGGRELLDLTIRTLKTESPELNWEDVMAVRDWLR
jgi:hypothetical protein